MLFLHKITFKRFLPSHALAMRCHNPSAKMLYQWNDPGSIKGTKKLLNIEPVWETENAWLRRDFKALLYIEKEDFLKVNFTKVLKE